MMKNFLRSPLYFIRYFIRKIGHSFPVMMIVTSVFSTNLSHCDVRKLFIMLDVDNTMVDRVDIGDKKLIFDLERSGFMMRDLVFDLDVNDMFLPHYRHMAQQNNHPFVVRNGAVRVQERVVVRPGLPYFMESIIKICNRHGVPVYILVCSRNDEGRTKDLIQKMDYPIMGAHFSNIVDFVPRKHFKVDILINGKKVQAKSAFLLRKNYSGRFPRIAEQDYVVLIDQLSDQRFITSPHGGDINLIIPHFRIQEGIDRFDPKEDLDALEIAINKMGRILEASL